MNDYVEVEKINGLFGTATSSFQNTLAGGDPNETFILLSGVVFKNKGIETAQGSTQLVKYNTNTDTLTELSTIEDDFFSLKNTQAGTNGENFIISSPTTKPKFAAKIYNMTGSGTFTTKIIPAHYSQGGVQEGTACAISPKTPADRIYVVIGVLGKSEVNLYKKDIADINYSLLKTFSLSQGGGNALTFVYGANTSELYMVTSIGGTIPMTSQDSVLKGKVEIYDTTSLSLIQEIVPPSEDYYLFGYTVATSSVIIPTSNKLLITALKLIGKTFYKVILIYTLSGSLFDTTPEEIVQTDLSLSGSVGITNSNNIIISGISYLTQDANTKGYTDIYEFDGGSSKYLFRDQIATNGFAVSVSDTAVANEYLVQVGTSPSLIIGSEGNQKMFQNDSGDIHCPAYIDGDTKWPRSLPGIIGVGSEACQPGYTPNVPVMNRTCQASGLWDTLNDKCQLLQNYCSVLEENNVEWEATAVGGTRQGHCSPGTKPLVDNLQRSCLDGGVWANTFASCQINYGTCPVIIENNIIWSETPGEQTGKGTCQVGFVPENKDNKLERECGMLGIWKQSNNKCVLSKTIINDQQIYSAAFGTIFALVLLGFIWIIFVYR